MKNNYLERNKSIEKKLELQINKGNEIIQYLKDNHSIEEMEETFNKWKKETGDILLKEYKENDKNKLFLMKTECITNKLSRVNTSYIIKKSIDDGTNFIKDIINENVKINIDNDILDEKATIIILRRILRNFYKHIQAMYQDKLHGNGTIKKKDIDEIKIGNEYDVQRMLYSIIRPIFPTARLEVVDDTGYKPIRYDIKIDDYNIVIEIKCTRKNMSERNLTEELGADVFNYNANYIFFFIYDRECIIKNVDSFMRNYKREKFNGKIEAIVNQTINI